MIHGYDLHSRTWLRWLARIYEMRTRFFPPLPYPLPDFPRDESTSPEPFPPATYIDEHRQFRQTFQQFKTEINYLIQMLNSAMISIKPEPPLDMQQDLSNP
jgi:hypothetical protein